ncbi:MAG: hypothetical protein KGZ30_02280 [Anaplasmataceae bacterium]|nr:hypothetical protein [Anaplasmataceae bacterium]
MKKMLMVSAVLAVVAGVAMVIGGGWGIYFTYQNIIQEKIVTSEDASIPNSPVRGPFTLKAQADVIRKHTLNSTNGQVYAEMPRQVPKTDELGNRVVDAEGNPVMIPNEARNIWVTATTLTTALNLGILTYAFSALILFFGLVSIWTGITFGVLSSRHY